jgi:8-oxo-dGTP pyrophosphatase MutT (NUDIX family)
MTLRSGVILISGDLFLLVQTCHNGEGVWGFPKGMVESPDRKESAEREFYEETGIQFKLHDYRTLRIWNTVYYIEYIETPLSLNYEDVPDKNEIKDLRWVSFQELVNGSIGLMNRTLRFFVAKHIHKFVTIA